MEHTKTKEEVLNDLATSVKGITQEEAALRIEKYGTNSISEGKKISALSIFISQFMSFIVYIMIAAIAVSAFVGEYIDALVIGIIVILNAVFGFVQEYRAEKSIEALKRMASLKAKVIRDGKEMEIDASLVVPGDVLILDEGDKVSADARLLHVAGLETLESALTGESTPVEKKDVMLEEGVGIADRKNMVFSGTVVTKGHAKAVVVQTGMTTEIGKIAKMIQDADTVVTPLQKKLGTLGTWLGLLTILICVTVFVVGALKTGEITKMLIAGIALAVAAIPEGLPAVVTISLALGVQRMIKRNSLIRKLPSVETLGCTTVICSDKTGTLTHNQMTVKKVYANGCVIDVSGEGYATEGSFASDPHKFSLLLKIGALCNNSTIVEKEVMGDPTEAALLVSAAKAGLTVDKLSKKYVRVDEIPFDSNRKLMTTIHDVNGKKWAFSKGAVDQLLKRCNKIYENGAVRVLTDDDRERILSMNESFASDALRVLAFACKKIAGDACDTTHFDETYLTFVGLQGMIDPPRAEAKGAIATCHEAGIKVVMITGDHKTTAAAIGRELGLVGEAMTGAEIDSCDDLSSIVDKMSIFARVNPEHKLRIVEAFRKNGHIIAMTGDGVNDAPALKSADIGIAMGVSGTDVAKEASDMILTDDNFTSIVSAVEEGRSIYDNIKKFVNYLLSSNFGEVLVLFVAMLIGFGENGSVVLPLVAVQILWMNLITDGLPALALGVDPLSKGVMQRKPRKTSASIVSLNMAANIIAIGVLICVATLFLFTIGLETSVEKGQTMAFTTLVVLEIVRVYMIRSQYDLGVFSNWYLLGAIAISLVLQLVVIYTPLNAVFKTVALGLVDWVWIGMTTVVVLIIGLLLSRVIVQLTQEVD